MSREITTHKVNGLNEALQVTVLDEPGAGGACHEYRVRLPLIQPAESAPLENSKRIRAACDLRFQKGPIAEEGYNGITNEVLLAVLIDRMEGFQSGPFACEENKQALYSLKDAWAHLNRRTKQRIERGVEGTLAK